jgi:hypothetical protein
MMLFLDIFFCFSTNANFFCLFEGGKLGMGNYDSITKVSFWQLGGVSNGTFVAHTSFNSCLTLAPPCLDGALPLKAPSLFSHLRPHCFH